MENAKKLIDKKADYVLALKANHPTLCSQVREWFETSLAKNFQGIDVSYDKLIIFRDLMSVMTNGLRKDINAGKFGKFGLYPLP
ncbi:MAG: hypothetical protein MET45_26145 [Nostoc sp. LLA-1]|nr:hypothetical protein [Cyanocohniella sp. LLY]